MQTLTRRTTVFGLATWPLMSRAASVPYNLDADGSEVGFIYTLSGNATKGTMPVKSASVTIDPQALQNSTIDVSVDVTRARAGLIFATEALKAASVLNANNHPTIRFRSRAIRLNSSGQLSGGAKIDGQITIKGVTRPITLDAALYRQRGSAVDDLSRLSFQVKGRVLRSAFGATGYADLVRDEIDLDIIARVVRA